MYAMPLGVPFAQKLLLLLFVPVRALRKGKLRLGVHNDAIAAGQGGFEEWIGGRQGHSAVSTFDDEGYVRKDTLHSRQSAAMMAQEVASYGV